MVFEKSINILLSRACVDVTNIMLFIEIGNKALSKHKIKFIPLYEKTSGLFFFATILNCLQIGSKQTEWMQFAEETY